MLRHHPSMQIPSELFVQLGAGSWRDWSGYLYLNSLGWSANPERSHMNFTWLQGAAILGILS